MIANNVEEKRMTERRTELTKVIMGKGLTTNETEAYIASNMTPENIHKNIISKLKNYKDKLHNRAKTGLKINITYQLSEWKKEISSGESMKRLNVIDVKLEQVIEVYNKIQTSKLEEGIKMKRLENVKKYGTNILKFQTQVEEEIKTVKSQTVQKKWSKAAGQSLNEKQTENALQRTRALIGQAHVIQSRQTLEDAQEAGRIGNARPGELQSAAKVMASAERRGGNSKVKARSELGKNLTKAFTSTKNTSPINIFIKSLLPPKKPAKGFMPPTVLQTKKTNAKKFIPTDLSNSQIKSATSSINKSKNRESLIQALTKIRGMTSTKE